MNPVNRCPTDAFERVLAVGVGVGVEEGDCSVGVASPVDDDAAVEVAIAPGGGVRVGVREGDRSVGVDVAVGTGDASRSPAVDAAGPAGPPQAAIKTKENITTAPLAPLVRIIGVRSISVRLVLSTL